MVITRATCSHTKKFCVLPTQSVYLWISFDSHNTLKVRDFFSGFSRDVDGICFLLGHYAAQSDNSQRHFGTTIRFHLQGPRSSSTTLRNIPEQRRSQRETLPYILTDLRYLIFSRSTTREPLQFEAARSLEMSGNTQRCNVTFQKLDIHTTNRLLLVMVQTQVVGVWEVVNDVFTRVGTLIVATIYLQLIQNRYMFRSFTVLHCSHQHCLQPVTSDVGVVGYLQQRLLCW